MTTVYKSSFTKKEASGGIPWVRDPARLTLGCGIRLARPLGRGIRLARPQGRGIRLARPRGRGLRLARPLGCGVCCGLGVYIPFPFLPNSYLRFK